MISRRAVLAGGAAAPIVASPAAELLAGAGLDIRAVRITAADGRVLAYHRMTVEQICRIFSVPPELLADLSPPRVSAPE